MKSLALLVAIAVVAALALPAGATSPPRKEITRLKRQVAVLQAKVKRLETENRQLVEAGVASLRRQHALTRRIAAVDPCPITHPNGSQPPGSTFGAEFHGNGALWVGMPFSNVVIAAPSADGSIVEKFGWWREVSGRLRIEGRRLDGPAPPLRASVPEGYGDSGFQSSGVVFPAEGCWEVTGRVTDASLTFVTLALAA